MRVVVVSGASRGLGRAIALRFGQERVAVLYREREEEAQQVAAEINKQGGEAFCHRLNVGVAKQVREVVGKIVERWGHIDILMNNAGTVNDDLLIKMDEAQWDEVLQTNLTGPMNLIRAVAPIMQQNGGGHIVNIGSISGFKGREGQVNYAASKGGLWGLTAAAANDLGASNIQVNLVIPGLLETDMGKVVPPTTRERIMEDLSLGRTSTLDEVADFIHHLCGMKNVSGQAFNLDSRIVFEG